jgi:hypothetical protein
LRRSDYGFSRFSSGSDPASAISEDNYARVPQFKPGSTIFVASARPYFNGYDKSHRHLRVLFANTRGFRSFPRDQMRVSVFPSIASACSAGDSWF